MKRIVMLIIALGILLWSVRIYYVNQNQDSVIYRHMTEQFSMGDINIRPVESQLYSQQQYVNRFHISKDNVSIDMKESDSLILCVCLELTNTSDNDISWDSLFGFLGQGFESITWASCVDPYLTSPVNIFEQENISPGYTQKVWYATTVNKSCFKERNWNHIREESFDFVVSYNPHKTVVRLNYE